MNKRFEISNVDDTVCIFMNDTDGILLEHIAFQYNEIAQHCMKIGFGIYNEQEIRDFLIFLHANMTDARFGDDGSKFVNFNNRQYAICLTWEQKRLLEFIMRCGIYKIVSARGVFSESQIIDFITAFYANLWFHYKD